RQSNRYRDIATFSEIALLAGEVFGLYSFPNLNETKVWLIAVVAAGTDADEFDLSDDEPVTTTVVTHAFLQMRQGAEVLDSTSRAFSAHARVPAIV
ncbi:hypothetical protein LTR72_012593, partial [Exophiala xenobiotica]